MDFQEVERLCNNLVGIGSEEIKLIKENYYKEISDRFLELPIALFDDSDVSKEYGKKF